MTKLVRLAMSRSSAYLDELFLVAVSNAGGWLHRESGWAHLSRARAMLTALLFAHA